MNKLLSASMYEIEIHGVNIERCVLPELLKIHAYDIDRPKYNQLSCKIKSKYFKSLRQKLYNYDIQVVDSFGFARLPKVLKYNLGIICATILAVAAILVISRFTFRIEVVGDSNLRDEIIRVINEGDIDISRATTGQIEDYILANTSDISMVSASKVGTTLIISVKEKVLLESDFAPLYASETMMIKSIHVLQGTPSVNVGDIVSMGDVLVEPYIIASDGVKMRVCPRAEIIADVWYSGIVKFEEESTEIVDTGNTQTNVEYSMFGKVISSNSKNCKFENYRVKEEEGYLSNFFLPIYLKRTTYIEQKTITVQHNYEEEYDNLVAQSKALAYGKNKENAEILDENLDIIDLSSVKYIKTTIHVEKRIYE